MRCCLGLTEKCYGARWTCFLTTKATYIKTVSCILARSRNHRIAPALGSRPTIN